MSRSENRARSKLTQIRLTPDEATVLEARRVAGGFQSVADMIRVRCLHRRPLRTRLDVVHLIRVETAINRLGGNVNQIAARANKSGQVTPEQLAAVDAALQEVLRLVEGLYPDRKGKGGGSEETGSEE